MESKEDWAEQASKVFDRAVKKNGRAYIASILNKGGTHISCKFLMGPHTKPDMIIGMLSEPIIQVCGNDYTQIYDVLKAIKRYIKYREQGYGGAGGE